MPKLEIMNVKILTIALTVTLFFAINHSALAWGERGHDVVTRVAVQHMRDLSGGDVNLMRPFLLRDHLLSHLSNAPDTVWRADYMSDQAKQANSPTHYISLEKVNLGKLADGIQDWSKVPLSFDAYKALCNDYGMAPDDVGTAPWRVLQLYKLMVEELTGLDNKPEELKVHHINQALNYAGLMAHFVADLANPHLTTENHDGQLSGNTGRYYYFESAVVSELSFKLPRKVRLKASKRHLWLKSYKLKQRKEILGDPQKIVWALIADSHANLERLMKLDNRYSLIEKGSLNNRSFSAQRKTTSKAAKHYERFVIERLAIAVDVLARLWQQAWQDAGSPNMSNFASYYYPTQPPFITPSY